MATTGRPRQIISIWMEPDTIERLEQLAREADRSRSAELRVAVNQYLERAAPTTDEGDAMSEPITIGSCPEGRQLEGNANRPAGGRGAEASVLVNANGELVDVGIAEEWRPLAHDELPAIIQTCRRQAERFLDAAVAVASSPTG